MTRKKFWYRDFNRQLTKEAKIAKSYVLRICKLLSKLGNRNFHIEMQAYCNIFEGHIIDDRKVKDGDYEEYLKDCLDEVREDVLNEDIGMIFWGGYYSRKKHKDALSKAWTSLLTDCVGNSPDRELAECHNLTKDLKLLFGPKIDLNCKTVDDLEKILKEHGV